MSMKFAIIETGGKQYQIEEGKSLRVEKLVPKNSSGTKGAAGEKKDPNGLISFDFDKVLLFVDGEKAVIGTPYILGAVVSAEHIRDGRAKKVTTIKYKQKSRYFKKRGHKQPFTEVKIAGIKETKGK